MKEDELKMNRFQQCGFLLLDSCCSVFPSSIFSFLFRKKNIHRNHYNLTFQNKKSNFYRKTCEDYFPRRVEGWKDKQTFSGISCVHCQCSTLHCTVRYNKVGNRFTGELHIDKLRSLITHHTTAVDVSWLFSSSPWSLDKLE